MKTYEERLQAIINTTIGEFRGAKGLFAQSIGCDGRQLGLWLKGSRRPSQVYLDAMTRNHKVDAEWLVTGEGAMFIS